MSADPPELRVTLPSTPGYGEPIRQALVSSLGQDGAWLLLSLDHYAWRAIYDLANATVLGASRIDGATSHHRRHLQSVVDLQVQSFMLGAVEQWARLIKAVGAHQDSTTAFFDA